MDLQDMCALGQEQLNQTDYLAADRTLSQAEQLAWEGRDFDTLARLYMPLQETRRQARLRAGEGTIRLDLIARAPTETLAAEQIVAEYSQGQLMVAGWGSLAPAATVRAIARERRLYLETFLAATYPVGGESRVVVIAPTETARLPDPAERTIDQLLTMLPLGCLVIDAHDLPVGPRRGTNETFAEVSALWERLHLPFLSQADVEAEPLARIEAYRRTIDIDRGCEFAHQRLSQTAHGLARRR